MADFQGFLSGLGSWYSQLPNGQNGRWIDRGDRPGSNALGVPDSQQGIATPGRAGLGMYYDVEGPDGQRYRLPKTDVGPAPWTGRGIDISAAAADNVMGYSPKNFPTDAPFKFGLSRDQSPDGPSQYASGSPFGLPQQAQDALPPEITGGRSMPPQAQLTRGTMPPQLLSQMQPQQAPGFGDRLSAGFQGFAHGGALLPAIGNLLSGIMTGQRADPQGRQLAQEQTLQQYGQNAPGVDPQLRALAAQNPAVAEAIIKQQLQPPALEKGSPDVFGNTPFFTYKNGQLNPLTPGGGGAAAGAGGTPATTGDVPGMSLFAPGVTKVDSSLAGDDYLKQFSPEIQSAVKSYINGDVMPTGNPRQKGIANVAKTIAQKYGQDTGQEVNDRTYAAKRQFQVDLSRTNPASAGGQRVAMKTGIEHMETLAKKAEDLGNVDVLGIAPLGQLVNKARGLGTEQAGKVNAVNQAAQLFSAEIIKMYSGSSGGGVHERDQMRQVFNAAKTPQELGNAIETGLDLIAGRRHALENTRDTLSSNAEILNKEDDARIARIRDIASRLKAGGVSAPAAAPAGGRPPLSSFNR